MRPTDDQKIIRFDRRHMAVNATRSERNFGVRNG